MAKILVGVTVGYLLSPIDLIPDFIPVLGLLDDLIIVPALIYAYPSPVKKFPFYQKHTYLIHSFNSLAANSLHKPE